MISNTRSSRQLSDLYSDPKRKEREESYINGEVFPTLDLSVEGIQESISKVCSECQQGKDLLEEVDRTLAALYSRISAFSSSENPCFSMESVFELDALVKEYEAKRALIYEVLTRKLSLKSELELLYLDLTIKRQRQQLGSSLRSPSSPEPSGSCSDWSMTSGAAVERDEDSHVFGDLMTDQEGASDDYDDSYSSMVLEASVSDSHSTSSEYSQPNQPESRLQSREEV